jgi:hypothetical protein
MTNSCDFKADVEAVNGCEKARIKAENKPMRVKSRSHLFKV